MLDKSFFTELTRFGAVMGAIAIVSLALYGWGG